MPEGQEVNPLANIQKTARIQQERVRELETGFEDDLKGKETSGQVTAKYERGRGGWVDTNINSGQATLTQT